MRGSQRSVCSPEAGRKKFPTICLFSCERPGYFIGTVRFSFSYLSYLTSITQLREKILKEELGELPVRIVVDDTYNVVGHSDLAVVASGTATLEAALIGNSIDCSLQDIHSNLDHGTISRKRPSLLPGQSDCREKNCSRALSSRIHRREPFQ